MSTALLTKVAVDLVNKHANSDAYGVSLVGIPTFDYVSFMNQLHIGKPVEVFFLGFPHSVTEQIDGSCIPKDITCAYSVEAAEQSRNSGNEDVFRILIIKRVELEKLSSLRWFPEINLDKFYTRSCELVRKEIAGTNKVIEALLQALRSKPIRSILSFERVLDYLEILIAAEPSMLPEAIVRNFYKLGLLMDTHIVDNNPSKDEFIRRIRRNYGVIERIRSLDLAERQNITNYFARGTSNKSIPRMILSYYQHPTTDMLQQMDLDLVEECLKAAKERKTPARSNKKPTINPTALAAQLVFDEDPQQIEDALKSIGEKVDKRTNEKKSERIDVEINGMRMQVKTEPLTEEIASEMTSEEEMGGIIYAEVQSPDEAIQASDKFEYTPRVRDSLDNIFETLHRISSIMDDDEHISKALNDFLSARAAVAAFSKRLQDAPMLQVLSKYKLFAEYIAAYEKLLLTINEEFHKVWYIAPFNAKEIVNTVMSLDYVFVIGKKGKHAVPTPLHPLYLWKYVELAREMLDSKGVSSLEENSLSEKDKSFIIRKADDIPDPLSVMLVPGSITGDDPVFLPLSGRIGSLPVYSNVPQINQSESGIDTLKQSITRYLCLYPHAGFMLRLALIDPPSVEVVVSMLKSLDRDREFSFEGIDVTILRTKEVPNSWIEITDEALNDGMLGRYKGKRSTHFNLRIVNQAIGYQRILETLDTKQHIIVVFDPNEVRVETAQNNKQIHIHPLCVPKVYKYNPINEEVEIRPASEGSIFTLYSSILEKLNEHPSSFSHTSTYFRTPLKRSTYDQMLEKADWLVILDQSLKCWDISLRAASEKLFYRENDYRSIGIYSSNCKKFVLGYDTLVRQLGNFIPRTEGLKSVIEAVREINDDGLLSIVSHTSNQIFDDKHGKGSLGLAIAAIHFKKLLPEAILVGLDTQLAQEWLSDRDEGKLPDLVGLRFEQDGTAMIDIIEVKTYSQNPNSFEIDENQITGNAVIQVAVLESLLREMCGNAERITTVSRREILREQVFEALFQARIDPMVKRGLAEHLNNLFAGEYKVSVVKHIAFVDFDNPDSTTQEYHGAGDYASETFHLNTIGSSEIQAILANAEFNASEMLVPENTANVVPEEVAANLSAEVQAPSLSPTAGNSELVSEDEVPDASILKEKCARLNKVFRDYGIEALPVNEDQVQEAARFTRFRVQLRSGETIGSLKKYIRDIERELEATGEILIDHIKGTRLISVDVPFAGASKPINLLKNLSLVSSANARLPFIAGQLPDGTFEIMDLAAAPHMLVAGTTGSGKTIFLHSILVSLLHQYSKDDLELLIIDPKQTDFIQYEDLPNLYGGEVVIDAEQALEMLQRLNTIDKEERTQLLRSCRSRDIDSYNEKNPHNKMKRIVVVIDEYSDLIQAAEMQGNRKSFEDNLRMLLQRVRNLGIHLIIATQRPSAQIVTGALKANIPFRVSFRLPSHTDSQTILDMPGAETLLGKGDMLMVTETDTKRMQGLYISEAELDEFIKGKLE